MNIAVFASHGGSNMQAVIDAVAEGRLAARVVAVISNNSDSLAMRRAVRADIPAYHISAMTHSSPESMTAKMLEVLDESRTDIILLLGYMRMLPIEVIHRFRGRIFNIHPSLLPRHGGKGMYGIRVHESVIASDDTVTGVTIHRVDEVYDRGEIVAQTHVPVLPGDTAKTLAERVLEREHTFLVETVNAILRGEISL